MAFPKTMKTMYYKDPSNSFEFLYHRYCSEKASPFFTDISGPEPIEDLEDFVNYLTDEASFVVLYNNSNQPCGIVVFVDIQPVLAMANLDFFIFKEIEDAKIEMSNFLKKDLKNLMSDSSITRVQAMVCTDDIEKIDSLLNSGFHLEGCLKEHFYHNKKFHDLNAYALVLPNRK